MDQMDKTNLPNERCNAIEEIMDKIREAVPGINRPAVNRIEHARLRYEKWQSIRSTLVAADLAES